MDHAKQPRPNLKLKQERERRNWTQMRLATEIGVAVDTVGKWERGIDTPSLYARDKLCKLFGKKAVELGFKQAVEEFEEDKKSRLLSKKEQPFPAIWNVPHNENPLFTGREQLLHQLRDTLLSQDAVVVTQTLSGLGGIGKTQLAVKYCYDYRQEYKAVLWARADPPELLVSDLLDIAKLLKLPECRFKEQQSILNGLRRWMREQSRWLLIIDNIENIDVLKDILPPARRGHVLITTRTQITGILPKVTLQPMHTDEGALLLLRRANMLAPDANLDQIREDELTMVRRVSQTLGGLPLALDQAGAYLQETGCSLQGYLEEYERKRSELLSYRGSESSEHPESVTTTFSLCFERVKQVNTVAADILQASAFLHPDAIPEELFLKGSKELGPTFQKLSSGLASLDHLMTPLLRYSLLERNPQQKTLRIHRLVQAVLLDKMDRETQRLWAKRVIKAVSSQLLFDAVVDQPKQQYALQSQACVRLINTWDFHFVEAARMLCAAGRYQYLDGYYTQAETLCSKALTMFSNLPAVSVEDTDVCLISLTMIKIDQGNLLEAEVLSKHLLSESENQFGPEHRMTALCLYYLAVVYIKREMFDQAEPLIRRAIAIYTSMPSAQNAPMTELLVTLAKIYSHQGRPTEAEMLYLEALLKNEQTYGSDHPKVANVLNELAIYYASQQERAKEEQCRQRALAIYTQSLHDEHPDRAITLAGLSVTAFSQGKYEEAEKYYEQALAIWERKLRTKHSPEIVDLLRSASSEQKGAEKKQMQAFLDVLSDVGRPDEKDAIAAATRLSNTLLAQEKYDEAGELLWYALESSVKSRGNSDLMTMYCTGNLACFYHLQKEYDIAELLYERAIQLAGVAFRFSPPGTLQIAENYIHFLKESGRDRQAAEIEKQFDALKKSTL